MRANFTSPSKRRRRAASITAGPALRVNQISHARENHLQYATEARTGSHGLMCATLAIVFALMALIVFRVAYRLVAAFALYQALPPLNRELLLLQGGTAAILSRANSRALAARTIPCIRRKAPPLNGGQIRDDSQVHPAYVPSQRRASIRSYALIG